MMAETGSGDNAERYEFDAPSHVVDLKELETGEDENEDEWFGKPHLFCTFLACLFSPLHSGSITSSICEDVRNKVCLKKEKYKQ